MKALCDAGNIGINLFELRNSRKLTFPPLPMIFEGTFDLIPFILYESLIMDGNSIEYLFQEKLINDKTKVLLNGLLYDKIIIEMDYVQHLNINKNKIWNQYLQDYNLIKNDIFKNRINSHYFKSKTDWIEFAKRIHKHPKGSHFFSDTEKSVQNNLSRIISGKLIPRDYRFLKENIIDVNCVHTLSLNLGYPIYCWSDWAHYYNFKSELQTQKVMKRKSIEGKIISNLWKLIFPRMNLNRIPPDAFRKLLETGVIANIREFVETTHLAPENITREWYNEIKNNALRDENAIRVFQVFSFCTSCLVGITTEPLVGVGTGVISFLTEKALKCIANYKNRLTFTFQEAREIVGERAEFS